jgi:hypothetical protein
MKKLEFYLPKNDLYHVLLKLACWFWRRFLFEISMYFYSFLNLKKGVVIHLNNFVPHHIGTICANFSKIDPEILEKNFNAFWTNENLKV